MKSILMPATRGHDTHSTPDGYWREIDREFGFTLDVAANSENHKCEKYFTIDNDALIQDWSGNVVWCNPPYSGNNIEKFLAKARLEQAKGVTSVHLLPSKTDVKWLHEHCLKASEIRFIKGRLKFGSATSTAPFGSMLVVFRGAEEK